MEYSAPVSSIFAVPSQMYVSTLMNRWIGKWWWALVIPPVAFVIAGTVTNQAFFYVALMLIFLLYPGIMMIVYYSYALTLDARAEIIPHRISFNTEEIKIEYFNIETDKDENKNYYPATTTVIPYSDVTNYTDTGRALILDRNNDKMSVIIIPLWAVSVENATQITDILYKKIQFNKI